MSRALLAVLLSAPTAPAAAQSMGDIIAGEIFKGVVKGITDGIKAAPANRALAAARAEAQELEAQNAVLEQRARELDAANAKLEEQTREVERQLAEEESRWRELERQHDLEQAKGELLEDLKPMAGGTAAAGFKGLLEPETGRRKTKEGADRAPRARAEAASFKTVSEDPTPPKAAPSP